MADTIPRYPQVSDLNAQAKRCPQPAFPVPGNGDYLPEWAGNLDIMTAAAARVGELA